MNSQTTPVHIHLWHREFWLLVIANLLLAMSVYMLIPTFPQWLLTSRHFTPQQTGWSMVAFAVGLYMFGAQCSWLVQRFRRNVVCMWAIAALAANVLLLGYFGSKASLAVVVLHRLLLGASFGMAQMILTSTLIIDTCESHHRTEANYGAAWFSRFALSLGPVVGLPLAIMPFHSYLSSFPCQISWITPVLFVSGMMALVSMLLIRQVSFPFRTPEEGVSMFSLDRFFLPSGIVLFLNLLLISLVVGLILSLSFSLVFYALMMGGFLLSLMAQRFVFHDADLISEVISGLILLLSSQLVLLFYPSSPAAPVLLGMAVGIVSSRFLLFFIKLSRHCQRGTSQSTYFLGWETGLALGLGIGYGVFYHTPEKLFYTGIVITGIALLMYILFTHRWFLSHKNR